MARLFADYKPCLIPFFIQNIMHLLICNNPHEKTGFSVIKILIFPGDEHYPVFLLF